MKPRILFVDDEAHVLESLADLWGYDYDVATAIDGASGLDMIAAWDPAVIVSDMRMPGMDGAAFLAAARAAAPNTVRILLTGQADLEAAARAVNVGGIFKLLTKPCSQDLMEVALAEALQLHADQVRTELLSGQLARAEQLATLGTMSAMLSHEMNNAVSLLSCAIAFVEDDADAGRVPDGETVRELVLGRDRLVAQTRGVMSLARRSDHAIETLDLRDVLETLVETIRSTGIASCAELLLEAESGVLVGVNRGELGQVILNLVKNSLDALPDRRGRVAIRTRRVGGCAAVTIEDSGSGIAPKDLARVFEPYFTTKPAAQGTGLGLAVAKQIISSYGGTIGIASRVGVGTSITIELPLASPPSQPRPTGETLAP